MATTASNPNCWAEFWDKNDYDSKEHHERVEGPRNVAKLGDWPGTTNDETNDFSSLKTGPECWLEVFNDPDYGSATYLFPPNSNVPALELISQGGISTWENCISSYKMHDSNPWA